MNIQGLRKPSRPINPARHIKCDPFIENFNDDIQFCSVFENTPPSSPELEEVYFNPVPTKRRVSNYVRPEIATSTKFNAAGSNEANFLKEVPKIISVEENKNLSQLTRRVAKYIKPILKGVAVEEPKLNKISSVDIKQKEAVQQTPIKSKVDTSATTKDTPKHIKIDNAEIRDLIKPKKENNSKLRDKIEILENVQLLPPAILPATFQQSIKRKANINESVPASKRVCVDSPRGTISQFKQKRAVTESIKQEFSPITKVQHRKADKIVSRPQKIPSNASITTKIQHSIAPVPQSKIQRGLMNISCNNTVPKAIEDPDENPILNFFNNDTTIHSDEEFHKVFNNLVELGRKNQFKLESPIIHFNSPIECDEDFDKIFNNLVNLASEHSNVVH